MSPIFTIGKNLVGHDCSVWQKIRPPAAAALDVIHPDLIKTKQQKLPRELTANG